MLSSKNWLWHYQKLPEGITNTLKIKFTYMHTNTHLYMRKWYIQHNGKYNKNGKYNITKGDFKISINVS